MNLYELHSNPEELDLHDEAHEKVPDLVWEKYYNNPTKLKKREDVIAKSAEYSCYYALFVLETPFPKGEEAISKEAKYSYQYAKKILSLSSEEAKAWVKNRKSS